MNDHDMIARLGENSLRWIVTSRTRPDIEHTVQLDAFGGIGECSCEHFQFRIAPDLREGHRDGARRCSHILIARSVFADAMIQLLVGRKTEPTDQSAIKCPECNGTGYEEIDHGHYPCSRGCLPVNTACETCGPECIHGDPIRPCKTCGEPIGHGAWEHQCAICGGPCCTACSHDGAFNRVVCEGCHYENQ